MPMPGANVMSEISRYIALGGVIAVLVLGVYFWVMIIVHLIRLSRTPHPRKPWLNWFLTVFPLWLFFPHILTEQENHHRKKMLFFIGLFIISWGLGMSIIYFSDPLVEP